MVESKKSPETSTEEIVALSGVYSIPTGELEESINNVKKFNIEAQALRRRKDSAIYELKQTLIISADIERVDPKKDKKLNDSLEKLLSGVASTAQSTAHVHAKSTIIEQMQVLLSVLTFDACNIIYDKLLPFATDPEVKKAFKEEVGKAVIKLMCRDIMDVCTSAASLNGLMGEADKKQMQTLSEEMKAIIDNPEQSNEAFVEKVKGNLTEMLRLVKAVETKATTGAAEKCTILINVLTAALKVVTTLGMNPDAQKEFTTAKNSWDEIGKNEKLKNQARAVRWRMQTTEQNIAEAKSLSPNTNPPLTPGPTRAR